MWDFLFCISSLIQTQQNFLGIWVIFNVIFGLTNSFPISEVTPNQAFFYTFWLSNVICNLRAWVKFWGCKVTCVAFLVRFGEGGGLVMLEEGGGLFSLACMEEGNTFDATGWFFFPGSSSVGPSAGRFIPPIPPTAANTNKRRGRWDRKSETKAEQRDTDTHSGSVHGSSCNTGRHTSGYWGGQEP